VTPPWRQLFDAVERPYAAAAESLIQSDTFMDALTVGWRLRRRLTDPVQRSAEAWLGLWGMPTRADVTALVNQVASLERQVRSLSRALDSDGPAQPGPGRAPSRSA
jgi:hypothetical protein